MSAYRAPTPQLRELLERAGRLTGDEALALGEAYDLTWGAPTHRHLQMPRDWAWWRLHRTLTEHERSAAVDDLRQHLGDQWLPGHKVGHAIRDAAAATLAADLLEQGPFRRADYDMLLAPWRVATQRCFRSRLALELASRWPGPVEDLWAVADACLADPTGEL